MLGRLGWYVTTIGTLLVAFLGRGANVSSLVFNLALLICFKTNAFLYPLATRNLHRSAAPVIKPIQPRTYSSKTQSLGIWYAFLTHPRMTRSVAQILVFIRRLYVQISLYSSIVIYYLNIQVINPLSRPVPSELNRVKGFIDIIQKLHQLKLGPRPHHKNVSQIIECLLVT